MSKEKRFNVLDQIKEESPREPAIFACKAQKVEDGWAVKLSNHMIQLIIEDNNYLLWGKRAWDVSTSK